MRAEEGELGVECLSPTVSRTGDPDGRDERVVLAETDEHGGEHPRDWGLGHPVVLRGSPGRRGPFLLDRTMVLLLPAPFKVNVGRDPCAQVVLQMLDLAPEIGGEGRCRGHGAPSAAETLAWASIHSVSRRKNWPGAASGSGRRSMMAPWLPANWGTSSQIA